MVRYFIPSSRARIIIQTNHSLILDILQQSSIISTMSTMKMNLRLVRVSQFLQHFKLDISRQASTNVGCDHPSYSKLDILFTYCGTFIEIHLNLLLKILARYEDDEYWACFYHQVQANKDLGNGKALLPFVTECSYRSNCDPYIMPRPKSSTIPSFETMFPRPKGSVVPSPGFRGTSLRQGDSMVVIENFTVLCPNKTKLLYHINKSIRNLQLYIPPAVALDVL